MANFSFLRHDIAQQALRLKRLSLAALASLMVIPFIAVLHSRDYLEKPGLEWSTAAILTCIVVFYAVIRSGLNKKFRDPSLTVLQMVSAFFVTTSTAFYINNEARGIVLPILLMILYFGIYRLDTRAMTTVALINITFYGAMIAMLYSHRPEALDIDLELMRWLILALVSVWFGVIGDHVTKLRRELATRKIAIEALLERDELTGVGNRRFLTHAMEQLIGRAERTSRTSATFCVAMLDLDKFKEVNDSYGHAAGDMTLKAFARVAQEDLRKIDYFGRYGGEEFLLIMSDTRLDGALATAERLRSKVEAARVNDVDPNLIQTVSIGIAEYQHGESGEQVVLRADKAMYEAKTNGRNRVVVDHVDIPFAPIDTRPTRVE